MDLFTYSHPASLAEVIVSNRQFQATGSENSLAYLAGGTTLIDLMKLNVMRPRRIVDLSASAREYSDVTFDGVVLRLGAFAKMAAAAQHADVIENFPVVAESLSLAASPQIRNMATLGGNVLQRTRCAYFRDTSWPCNKRSPGSGCSALDGANRQHAVLGVSDHCIATYHGDFAQALIALDARVNVLGADGARSIPFSALHVAPGDKPNVETRLQPGEIITDFVVSASEATRRSRYLKIRDRQSYEFAVSSVAVALDIKDGLVADARIALGGLATVPWRSTDAENSLRGKAVNTETATAAADFAFRGAAPRKHNEFKIPLGRSAIVRALLETAAMEVRRG